MKHLLFFLILAIGSFLFTSCEKESQPSLELLNLSATVVEINNCEINETTTGSHININFAHSMQNVTVEKIINQYQTSEGVGGMLTMDVDEDDIKNGLNFTWCYYFENSEYIEESYKLVGTTSDGQTIESNTKTIRIDRPAGAN